MHRRTKWLALAYLALAAPSLAEPSREQRSLEAAFAAPTKVERPLVRWWWPGDAVDDAEIRREIALLDAAGFGGGEIQPFGLAITGATPAERAAIDSYAQPRFFAHVRTAAAAAMQHGLRLDYTFGSAWPSGGGMAITPEKALMELTMAATTVQGGNTAPITVAIPRRTSRLGAFPSFDQRWKTPAAADWPARMDARARIVAVLAVRGSAPELAKAKAAIPGLKLSAWSDVTHPGTLDPATTIDLTDKLSADGTLAWSAPAGTWQVLVFKQYAVNSSVTGSAGTGPQLVMDHFDAAAFTAHAARVGGPMVATIGSARSGIRATFIDSLELMQDLPWTERFLTEFKARRGYNLTPYLPYVVQPGWMQAWGERYSPPYYLSAGDVGARALADYRLTVSDLMIEGFVKPYVNWNRRHGFLAKFQAHGGPSDLIRSYGLADIPETENLGADYDAFDMRFARSAADIYGRPIVSAEALASAQHPYDPTPAWLRARIDLFFAAGVNAQTLHGYAYGAPTAKWPGWQPFAPTAFSTGFGTIFGPTNPIWAAMPALTGYMARTNAVMRQGRPVVPVAMFYGEIGQYRGIEDRGAGKNARERALLAGGYDYDRINPDGVSRSRVVARQLVTPGGHRYTALVLPATAALRAETAATIAGFAAAGLPVIYTGITPQRDEGLLDAARRDARVRDATARTLRAGAKRVPEDELVGALGAAGVAANLRFTGDARDIVFVQRSVGRRSVYFLYNSGDGPRDASFAVPSRTGVRRWNALDGTIAVHPSHATVTGTTVTLPLASHASALLVLDPADRGVAAPPPRQIDARALPSDGWSMTVEGHVTGGTPLSQTFPNVSLGDYASTPALAGFAGTATYAREFDMADAPRDPNRRVMLDLGTVHDMATVTINGHRLPSLIEAPWTQDVTKWLRPGRNRIEIGVANVIQNAMRDPGKPGFKTLAVVPAGLIGPISLRTVR